MSVVADVHGHPGGAGQSSFERGYPTISRAGHVAFILPDFVRPPAAQDSLGICRYLSGKHWDTAPTTAPPHLLPQRTVRPP